MGITIQCEANISPEKLGLKAASLRVSGATSVSRKGIPADRNRGITIPAMDRSDPTTNPPRILMFCRLEEGQSYRGGQET